MSTKSTIFLSEDNEHIYRDCDYAYNTDSYITIEIDSQNIHRATIDKFGDVIIDLKIDCDLAKWILSKQTH